MTRHAVWLVAVAVLCAYGWRSWRRARRIVPAGRDAMVIRAGAASIVRVGERGTLALNVGGPTVHLAGVLECTVTNPPFAVEVWLVDPPTGDPYGARYIVAGRDRFLTRPRGGDRLMLLANKSTRSDAIAAALLVTS